MKNELLYRQLCYATSACYARSGVCRVVTVMLMIVQENKTALRWSYSRSRLIPLIASVQPAFIKNAIEMGMGMGMGLENIILEPTVISTCGFVALCLNLSSIIYSLCFLLYIAPNPYILGFENSWIWTLLSSIFMDHIIHRWVVEKVTWKNKFECIQIWIALRKKIIHNIKHCESNWSGIIWKTHNLSSVKRNIDKFECCLFTPVKVSSIHELCRLFGFALTHWIKGCLLITWHIIREIEFL